MTNDRRVCELIHSSSVVQWTEASLEMNGAGAMGGSLEEEGWSKRERGIVTQEKEIEF